MAKLIIKFRCLCFFVRDEATDRMHVVTPGTCGHVEKHEAFLVFPKESGRLNSLGHFRKPNQPGKFDFVEMDGWSMVFPETDRPARLGLTRGIVSLNQAAGGAVLPEVVTGPRTGRITSRLTLPSGQMSDPEIPGTWTFLGETVGLARDVFWTVDGLPDQPLVLQRSTFEVGQEPGRETEEITIQPNHSGEFRLQFHNTLPGDFGHPLKDRDPGEAAQHYAAYYRMYGDIPATPHLPRFVRSRDIGVVGCVLGGGTAAQDGS
jgi:hypothetical protein